MFSKPVFLWIVAQPIVKAALVAIMVIAVAGGFYAYTEYNRRNSDMAEVKAAFSLSNTEVLQAFETDLTKANQQYLEKVLEIDGPIKALEQDDKGFYTVVLGTEESMSAVRCVIDSLYSAQAATLKIGSTARLRGVCVQFSADDMGLGSDLILNRCYPILVPGDSRFTQSQPVPSSETSRKVDATCLVDVDWCFPSCSDPSSTWKFSSDGTFNYSTTAFGGMSAWGTWTDLGEGKIDIHYTRSTDSNVPPDQVIRLTDCKNLRVGNTNYRTI